MRLLLIGSTPPPHHGTTVYTELLIHYMEPRADVRHLDTSDHRSIDNIGRFDLPNIYYAVRSLSRLCVFLARRQPDVIYIPISATSLGYLRDGALILLSSFLSAAPIIVHLHSGNHFRESLYNQSWWGMRAFIRLSLSRVHTAVVLSARFTEGLRDLVSCVEVVPNGVPSFRERTSGLNGTRPVVGYLGNLQRGKGVLETVMAAARCIHDGLEAEFQFAGAWISGQKGLKEEAEKLIGAEGIAAAVSFRGVLTGKEKRGFLDECSLLVFPTWYHLEGMPLSLLEAMEAGKPVIATEGIGAIEDVVVHGETGILVKPGSAAELADAICELLRNPERREAMGQAGRKRFERLFSIEKSLSRLDAIMRSAGGS